MRSVAVGVWVDAGVIHETPEKNGISHFIEHMVFKGTSSRNAFSIVHAIESRGGVLDAFTDRDTTCFYVHCLKEDLRLSVDLIGDMVSHPLLLESDVTLEKKVVLDEIASILDTPEEWIHDAVATSIWGDHPLGLPVLGTEESVRSFAQAGLRDYMRHRYCGRSVVVAAVGNLDHDRIARQVRESFQLPCDSNGLALRTPVSGSGTVHREEWTTSQAHVCVGMACPGLADARRHALWIVNCILGDGMSSRLFQKVREQLGLTYSIYSSLELFRDAGWLTIYATSDNSNLDRVVDLVGSELDEVVRDGLTAEEIASAKMQLKGALVLHHESSVSRMTRLAKQETTFGHVGEGIDDTIAAIDRVPESEIMEVCNAFLSRESRHQITLAPSPRRSSRRGRRGGEGDSAGSSAAKSDGAGDGGRASTARSRSSLCCPRA